MHKTKNRSSNTSKTQATHHENNSSKMQLKLLVHKQGPRVLFAEVPKEFVDFLFHIFSLPLGTLINLLGSNNMVGSLGRLKDSIESFHENYLQPGVKMDDIFNPKTPFNGNKFLLSHDASSDNQSAAGSCKTVYRCPKASACCRPYGYGSYGVGGKEPCCCNATLYYNSICPSCSAFMNVQMASVTPKEVAEAEVANKKKDKGYVKEVVTYMVMDDLVVKPMSSISSITVMNKCGVKDLGQLEEKTVSFGKDEGLKLLEACFKTDKVLTAIFMH